MSSILKPWPAVIITFATCIAAAMALFKVPPIIPVLMEALTIGEARAGMLMAVFSISGIVLAIPGGILIRRFGIYRAGLIALAFLAVGAAVGLVGGLYPVMLVSRLVEGIGLALLSIIGVLVVALVFPPDKRGAPMGLICLYVSIGELSMLNLAPRIAKIWGWPGVWWCGLLFTLLMLVVWLSRFKRLEHSYSEADAGQSAGRLPIRMVFKNARVWLLTISFTLFIGAFMGIFMFWPTYLNVEGTLSLTAAAGLVSLISFINIPGSFLSGFISDRLKSRKWPGLIGMAVCAMCYLFIFDASPGLRILLLILLGIFCITVPVVTFAAATEIFDDSGLAGVTVSLVTAGQNVGLFLGPSVMGFLVENQGWSFAFELMAAVTALGIMFLFFCKSK